MRQAEEVPGFFGNICEVDETERIPDHIQQIAIFTRGRVLPFTGNAFHAVVQTDEHGTARRVSDIADLPVIALFATIRQIVAAHRLGLSAETLRQLVERRRAALAHLDAQLASMPAERAHEEALP